MARARTRTVRRRSRLLAGRGAPCGDAGQCPLHEPAATRSACLEPGRTADFIAWDGSPLDDIGILQDRRRLRGVYLAGARDADRGSSLRSAPGHRFLAVELDGPLHPGARRRIARRGAGWRPRSSAGCMPDIVNSRLRRLYEYWSARAGRAQMAGAGRSRPGRHGLCARQRDPGRGLCRRRRRAIASACTARRWPSASAMT